MTLTTIEYGSLASSEVMNNNFAYLETKITDTTNDITTMISSILSNIATINSRLSDLSDDVKSSSTNVDSQLSNYKAKIKTLISKSNMLPFWRKTESVQDLSSYTAQSNGYLLILPSPAGIGNLTINGLTVELKARSSADDNASELIVIPIQESDVITTTVAFSKAYFVPVAEVTVEDF